MTLPGALLPWVELRFLKLSSDGLLVSNAGGTVTFYEAGTTTKQDTYPTSDLDPMTPNDNPIGLDDDGRPGSMIYILPTGYRVLVKDSAGATVYDEDNVSDPAYSYFASLGQQFAQGSKGVSSGYTITPSDALVTVDESSTDPAIVNLQTATAQTGQIAIQNVGSKPVAITPVSGETINGIAGPFTLPAAASPVFPTVVLWNDGTSAYFVASGWGLA